MTIDTNSVHLIEIIVGGAVSIITGILSYLTGHTRGRRKGAMGTRAGEPGATKSTQAAVGGSQGPGAAKSLD